jgi:hypothetical protein
MGVPTGKQTIVMRRWKSVNDNRAHMEDLILNLMENPATDPEHLAQAHAMYSGVCKQLSEISHHVTNVLRTGSSTGVEKLWETDKC